MIDIDDSLARPPAATELDAAVLPGLLRVLLATDGTVTETLEAWFRERVAVGGVRMDERDGIARREAVLTGLRSGWRYAHATSLISLSALPAAMRARLGESRRGIGEALHALKLPTYRAVEDRWSEPAASRAAALGCGASAVLAARRYGIWHDGRRCIQIVERFPIALYASADGAAPP